MINLIFFSSIVFLSISNIPSTNIVSNQGMANLPTVCYYKLDTAFSEKDEIQLDYAPRGLIFEVIELRQELHKVKDRVTDLELSLEKYKLKYPDYENKFRSQK